MEQEQLHVFPSTTFNSSSRQVDIVLTKNDIHILVNVVITNPMRVDLLFRSCALQGFVASNANQAKKKKQS